MKATQSVLGSDALVLRTDAGDIAEQKAIAKSVGDAFGQLDAVFVNAGMGDFRPIERWDEAGFDRSFAVNLKGPFFLVQALLPIFANPALLRLMTNHAEAGARVSQSWVHYQPSPKDGAK